MRLREVPALAIDAWFRPVSARPLAGLRVGLPLLLLVHLVWVSSDLLSLHGSRGIIPWELTDLLRDPWVPGLPTLAKRIAAPRDQRAHRHHLPALVLCGKPALARPGISHPSLGVSGVGPSPQPGHQRVCFFLRRRSAGQYVPFLSPRLSVRARLDVRVSVGLPTPRGDDSRRLSEGDASPPLRDLSRRRSLQGHGETVVERRGHLAGGLSARLSHLRSQLAGETSLDPHARWLGHVGGGDRLRVSHLATPHPEGVVPSRRSDCTWASACSWGSSSSRA